MLLLKHGAPLLLALQIEYGLEAKNEVYPSCEALAYTLRTPH